ncbi:hypothetical protein [Pseudolabrys sp. FHR47]|uniref:hypothetical protein n=1 Tax=Pseudolabrys sp. FHR47 TaxID=2562284 RepID=UPI0010BE593C|nr:hypothetical protein [Pseudolabrys sp. FHR47]
MTRIAGESLAPDSLVFDRFRLVDTIARRFPRKFFSQCADAFRTAEDVRCRRWERPGNTCVDQIRSALAACKKCLCHRAFLNSLVDAGNEKQGKRCRLRCVASLLCDYARRQRRRAAYAHESNESLFFFLRWCKPIVVQVDPRPHLCDTRHSKWLGGQQMAKRKKKAVKTAKKAKKKKKKL